MTTILKVKYTVFIKNNLSDTEKLVEGYITVDVYNLLKHLINFTIVETFGITDLFANVDNSLHCAKIVAENPKKYTKNGNFIAKGYEYPRIELIEDHITTQTEMKKRIKEMNNWVNTEYYKKGGKTLDYNILFNPFKK